MKLKLSNSRYNTFQVSIGDDGIVVVYTQRGYAKNKLFIRSTEEGDTERLAKLLNSDPDANIFLYIDTLDQSYLQKTIPGVGQLASNALVQKRLEKDIPENHFKSFVQIGRSSAGRQDWIYTFISAANEPPVSTWIEWFLPFKNIISGIYFMPVELYSVVQKIKQIALEENQFKETKKKKNLTSIFKALIGKKDVSDDARWELYLSQNKTGGFRQVAFQDGNIIFSRLINNINAPSAEIVAGNIEQEIANSIEYMMRLSLGTEKEVDTYLILSDEIIKHIRKDKIKASNLFIYTPFQLSKKLVVPEASSNTDKFADPTVLTYFSRSSFKTITLSTPTIKKVLLATHGINIFGNLAIFMAPVLIIASIYLVDGIIDIQSSIKQIQSQTKNFSAQINEQTKQVNEVASQVKENLKIDHVSEIVEVHEFLTKNTISPNSLILRLSDIMPQYARIKNISWVFDDPLLFAQTQNKSNVLSSSDRNYKMTLDLQVVLETEGTSFEELESKYAELSNILTVSFDKFSISVSDLPQSFTFQDINNPVSLSASIQFPPDSNNKRDLPAAQEVFDFNPAFNPSRTPQQQNRRSQNPNLPEG